MPRSQVTPRAMTLAVVVAVALVLVSIVGLSLGKAAWIDALAPSAEASATSSNAPAGPPPNSSFTHTFRAGSANKINPVLGPTSATVNLTSLTVSPSYETGQGHISLHVIRVKHSETTCARGRKISRVWRSPVRGGGPVSTTFASPVQLRPPQGFKICIVATVDDDMLVSLRGYFDR